MPRVRSSAVALVTALALLSGAATACSERRPVQAARGVLGTSIQMTVYGDDAAVRPAMDRAWAEMSAVQKQLDPYEASSAIAAVNAKPYESHELPPDAAEVYSAIDRLNVSEYFSPALWGPTRLYGFGGAESVPATGMLAGAVSAASALVRDGAAVRFERTGSIVTTAADGAAWLPGFDFGGASKGLALDRAAAELRRDASVQGALISAGSSTLSFGSKYDGTPWKIGIEDPRDPDTVVAVITMTATAPVNVSTSGDYQTYFELDGVRYHHILDPTTGTPARGLRSLTVYGTLSGLDADILSTALFVMGPEPAAAYAREHGLGLYEIDASGQVTSVPAPASAGMTLEQVAAPRR